MVLAARLAAGFCCFGGLRFGDAFFFAGARLGGALGFGTAAVVAFLVGSALRSAGGGDADLLGDADRFEMDFLALGDGAFFATDLFGGAFLACAFFAGGLFAGDPFEGVLDLPIPLLEGVLLLLGDELTIFAFFGEGLAFGAARFPPTVVVLDITGRALLIPAADSQSLITESPSMKISAFPPSSSNPNR